MTCKKEETSIHEKHTRDNSFVITGVKSKNTDFYLDHATKIEFWLQMGREKKVSKSQTLMDYVSRAYHI